jgi:hypothetical protein
MIDTTPRTTWTSVKPRSWSAATMRMSRTTHTAAVQPASAPTATRRARALPRHRAKITATASRVKLKARPVRPSFSPVSRSASPQMLKIRVVPHEQRPAHEGGGAAAHAARLGRPPAGSDSEAERTVRRHRPSARERVAGTRGSTARTSGRPQPDGEDSGADRNPTARTPAPTATRRRELRRRPQTRRRELRRRPQPDGENSAPTRNPTAERLRRRTATRRRELRRRPATDGEDGHPAT